MYGVLDELGPWPAFCFDNAVTMFGLAVEQALERIEGKTRKEVERKTERALHKWLGLPLKYRDPASIPTAAGTAQTFQLPGGGNG